MSARNTGTLHNDSLSLLNKLNYRKIKVALNLQKKNLQKTLQKDKSRYADCNSIIKMGITELVLELPAHKAKIKGSSERL